MKLYRIYKHIDNKDFNHLYIEIISDESYYEAIRIFTMKWQQNKGEHQYYAMSFDFNYDFTSKIKIEKFYEITKKLLKQNISSHNIMKKITIIGVITPENSEIIDRFFPESTHDRTFHNTFDEFSNTFDSIYDADMWITVEECVNFQKLTEQLKSIEYEYVFGHPVL